MSTIILMGHRTIISMIKNYILHEIFSFVFVILEMEHFQKASNANGLSSDLKSVMQNILL